MREKVFRASDQVLHNLDSIATEDGRRLEISDYDVSM